MVTVAAAGPQRPIASARVMASGSSQLVTAIPQPRQASETSSDCPMSVVISAAEQLFAATQSSVHPASSPHLHLRPISQVAAQPVKTVSSSAQVSGSSSGSQVDPQMRPSSGKEPSGKHDIQPASPAVTMHGMHPADI